MASPALNQAIQLLAETIDNLTKSKYTSAAGLTVVLYDIILLMSDGEPDQIYLMSGLDIDITLPQRSD